MWVDCGGIGGQMRCVCELCIGAMKRCGCRCEVGWWGSHVTTHHIITMDF